jgi:hypothetical protein
MHLTLNPTIQCTRHCSQFISPLRNDYTKNKCRGYIKCRNTWFNKVNVVKQWLLGCVTILFNIWLITNIWFLPIICLHFKVIKGNVLDDISSSSIFDLLAIIREMVFLKCGTFNFHGFGSSIFCKFTCANNSGPSPCTSVPNPHGQSHQIHHFCILIPMAIANKPM